MPVPSKYNGEAVRVEFQKGYLVSPKPKKIPNKEKKQGSRVYFIPDPEVMKEMDLSWKTVYSLIRDIMSLTPLGSSMDFEAVDKNGVVHKELIVNNDGIIANLIMKVKNPLNKPIMISFDDGTHKLETAFCYDGGDVTGPSDTYNATSYCNFCPTKEGTHIDGTIEGIARWFSRYMNTVFLANQKSKNKTTVTFNDIKAGLNIMISAAHLEPVFTGQAKEILSNDDMIPFCKDVVMKGLDEWSKSNPQDLNKLSKYFKDIADARMKMDKEKIKIVTKYQANVLTGLPSKYSKPTEQCKELIIVEGDSAGGSAKSGRDEKTQGIFPIRGKIPSAFEKTKQAFWDNAETQGIARIILNKDYTRNFDPINDVKWEKIIFMADGDVDGAHISSLLLRFFILYMPQLIEAGKVYKALPPLYGMKNGKKTLYFTDQLDFVRYVQKSFIQNNQIVDIDTKNKLTGKELTLLFMVNEDYVFELERLSMTYAVDPRLMEMALFNYYNKRAIGPLKKDLKKVFRFMDVSEKNGIMTYDGTIRESNFLFMNERLINDCQRLMNIIKKNNKLYYKLNGNVSSIYDIMKVFEKNTPSGIQRYKGLGEMDADQIAVSTLRPDSDRTLIRYTLEDAKEELAIIREFESDRSKLLDFVGTVKRSDLLE